MTYIRAIPEAEATGALAAIHAAEREHFGSLPNFTRAVSLRPGAHAAWPARRRSFFSTGLDAPRALSRTPVSARARRACARR
jgi:hypothetical protein